MLVLGCSLVTAVLSALATLGVIRLDKSAGYFAVASWVWIAGSLIAITVTSGSLLVGMGSLVVLSLASVTGASVMVYFHLDQTEKILMEALNASTR